MTLSDLAIVGWAVFAVSSLWFEGSIFAVLRSHLEAIAEMEQRELKTLRWFSRIWLARMLTCPLCLAPWLSGLALYWWYTPLAFEGLFALDAQHLEKFTVLWRFPVYLFACTGVSIALNRILNALE